MALNTGLNGSSSFFTRDTSVKIAERQSVKQLIATPLDSANRGQRWQSPCIEPRVKAQELCESRGGRPGLPVPNSPYGLLYVHVGARGRRATLN